MCKKHNALKSHGVIDRIEHRKSEDYSMLRPSIGIDWDDVTAPFNSIAIRMANEKYHPKEPYRMEEITSWANEGRTSVIKEFYNDPELYSRQIPTEETKRGIRRLMQIADVFFITAVSPHFMGVRAEQIMTQFPELPPENIILGSAKDRVHFDIVLDDAIHNILESKAEYPVLMRKPWNAKMTGLLSVNTMAEFVSLVKQIMKASTSKTEKITAPAVLALVGPSGSGKSTVANLIARFWDVTKGCVRIGGQNIRELNPDGLLHYISEVFQENTLLSDTIYNNIKAGREDATEQEVIAAAKAAHCHEFIERLPNGYQTHLAEGGNTLSGGEKQRIAIARAILKDAPILLLDESTASLDADNEAKINQALDRLMKGKTVFVIAHRLNTIQNADQIIVLNQGRIEETGTHEELLRKKGHYYEMVQEQQKAREWIVKGA